MRFAIIAVMALAGCELGVQDAAPVNAIALLGGAVKVAGPEGYCVDARASRARTGFAVLAPCVALGGDTQPAVAGLITVQVGAADTASVDGSEPALRGLLETENGAALLSREADAAAIDVLGTETADNRVTVHFTDSAAPIAEGVGPQEWRGFFDLGERLVTVSVYELIRAPLEPSRGRNLLDQAITGLIAVNTPDVATESPADS